MESDRRSKRIAAGLLLAALAALALSACGGETWKDVAVKPTVEDRTPDGEIYNPATQSFLREHHWLERVSSLDIRVGREGRGRIELHNHDASHRLSIENLPLDQLVPRLHYRPGDPPDAFDAFNLMMAEYARNSVSVPVGNDGDSMAHFRTTLEESVPWTLAGDYQFEPNPWFRPLRIGVINNCLRSGLWELNAVDRAGEIYHAWFDFPQPLYLELVAEVNGLEPSFVEEALRWSSEPVRLELDRLRHRLGSYGTMAIERVDGDVGYSSQDSRRKLQKHYVLLETANGAPQVPARLDQLVSTPLLLSDFVEPGKYDVDERKVFDLRFMAEPRSVDVHEVAPRTCYRMDAPESGGDHGGDTHLELVIDLGERRLVVGNLPLPLLVRQEDFVIHGFGVGILGAADFAERRAFLIDEGPHPSYAYLAEERDGELYALNSHEEGIEQIFLRAHPFEDPPYWELTLTSFERIVDLVKYRIEIPQLLREASRSHTARYVSPIYFTYRDDNLR